MHIFKKGESTKLIEDGSSLIERLIEEGWKCDDLEIKDVSELEDLRAKAKELGIKVHHKAGVDKIKALIEEHE